MLFSVLITIVRTWEKFLLFWNGGLAIYDQQRYRAQELQ